MPIAKVFKSGNSQAVRLPKQFRVKSSELEIIRHGKDILLRETRRDPARAFDLLASLPDNLSSNRDDLTNGRKNDPPQKRKGL